MKHSFYIFLCLLLIAGCSRNEFDTQVLARIGDDIITAEEFVMNYEFGHGHLRTGDDPKREYMQFLINESVLAQAAAAKQLDTLPAIQHALHTLREELLIERVFEEKVLNHIDVSEEEIRDEINRDAVSFQFRLLPVNTEAEGRRLRAVMLETSFEEVMEAQLAAIPELRQVEGDLTSPFVNADELDLEIVGIIQNLPLQEPSEPQFYRGAWYLFEVMNIRRQRLAEEDYQQKSPSYHKIIFNRKAMTQGTAFVAQLMEPLEVKTKRAGFEVLNQALLAWYKDKNPERNLLHYIEVQQLRTPYTKLLIENAQTPLVTYKDESWDIHDFLRHFTPGRYVLRTDDKQAFKARLADIVGLVVRDKVLLDIASQESLNDDPEYNRTLAMWKSKWLFQEYRNLLLSEQLDGDRKFIAAHAESLKDQFKIDVNWRMLDTLQTNVSAVNPTMTVHLFKNNANKMPLPIADPNWKREH